MPNPPPRAALLAPPLAAAGAWGAALYGLGYWYAPRPLDSVIYAAQMTPAHPLMIAAPAVAFAAAAAGSIALVRKARDGFGGAQFRTHLRGTKIVSAARLARMTRSWWRKPQVTVAGIPIPLRVENRGMLLVGAPGTGKTTSVKEIAFGAFRRGDSIIALDPNGDLLQCFYRPGVDIILNPNDARTIGWNLFNEIEHDWHIDMIAKSLVPGSRDLNTEEWRDFGRTLMASGIRKLRLEGSNSVARLHEKIALTDQGKLEVYLKGTSGEAISRGPDRGFQSVQMTLAKSLEAHMRMPEGNFSLRHWLANPKGNIYITWKPSQADSLRPLITAWTDFICAAIMDLPENEDRRIWLFPGELAALDKLPSLMRMNTLGRKFGLRVVADIHTIASLQNIYGDKETTALLSGFRSVLVLASSVTDNDTAAYFSTALGRHNVERARPSTQSGSGRGGRSSGKSESISYDIEPVIMESEITGLPDYDGFLRFAGYNTVARVTTKPINFKQQAPGFVARDGG